MIAQLLLSGLLFGILLYAWAEYRRSPVVALLSVWAAFAGLYFVWIPSHATRLAEFVGIGRGVDLILYTWVTPAASADRTLPRAGTRVLTNQVRNLERAKRSLRKMVAESRRKINHLCKHAGKYAQNVRRYVGRFSRELTMSDISILCPR
jgi:hypothetical protein